jgi:hypothetical protein
MTVPLLFDHAIATVILMLLLQIVMATAIAAAAGDVDD